MKFTEVPFWDVDNSKFKDDVENMDLKVERRRSLNTSKSNSMKICDQTKHKAEQRRYLALDCLCVWLDDGCVEGGGELWHSRQPANIPCVNP